MASSQDNLNVANLCLPRQGWANPKEQTDRRLADVFLARAITPTILRLPLPTRTSLGGKRLLGHVLG